uniref:Uncharacterized protein n=2 Tax=Schizaphis graminum TaxID=13262 RepID=A0A2S2NGX0_SCHGA
MSSTCLNEFSENEDAIHPSSPHQQLAQSGLRAGASPEKRTDGDRGCPNPCSRDEGPIDCKTLSVRRRLAEDLGCCGCTNEPETPCLQVTGDTGTCCQQQRRAATPNRCCPEPDANADEYVDPVEQIINEGLQQQQRKRHGRRRSSRSSRPAARPPATDRRSSYQPDYFDDQADMNNWRVHRDHSRRGETREQPSSSPPSQRHRSSLAFEPFIDDEQYSPARPSTPGGAPTRPPPPPPQNENQDVRQEMVLELQRLDEQRAHLLECMERERKIVEMVLEYKRQKRARPAAAEAVDPRDDRERIQRRIDEAKRKTAEVQRRLQQSGAHRCGADDEVPACPTAAAARCPTPSSSSAAKCPTSPPSASRCLQTPTPSPRNPTSTCSAAAGPETSTTSCQRRRLRYQPPSPDTDTEDESCAPPPPRRRLLKYRPPPPSDSSGEDAEGNECGRRQSAGNNADDRQSSLQDSYTYYNRSVRNGVPPVTADVPQQTSCPWTGR